LRYDPPRFKELNPRQRVYVEIPKPAHRPGFLSTSVDGQQVSTYPNINVLGEIVMNRATL
jgi:hypothetical protein